MHIFITGGTGFIGRELIQQLKSENHHFTLLTRDTEAKSDDLQINYCYSLDELVDLNDFDAVITLPVSRFLINVGQTNKNRN